MKEYEGSAVLIANLIKAACKRYTVWLQLADILEKANSMYSRKIREFQGIGEGSYG